jgi:trans-AT polyketide synthase/acyltransferase/oxidoreductase domain-containing protein
MYKFKIRSSEMVGYVFPGQGSQEFGMGQVLFEKYPNIVKSADEILGYSIEELCLKENDKLNNTYYTQPAVYVVNALHFFENYIDSVTDVIYAGHSLGEYNALLVAGVFSFEDGLKIVKRRAEIMSVSTGGMMMAVIGGNEKMIQDVIRTCNLSNVQISNYNSPKQIVVAGIEDELKIVKSKLEEQECICQFLKVSGAFHSSSFKKEAQEFAEYLANFEFKTPSAPVISNVTGKTYTDNIRELLSNHLIMPVQWVRTIEYMLEHGANEIIQVGHGRTLIGINKQIIGSWKRRSAEL